MDAVKKEIPILAFSSPKEWENWLSKNYTDQNGIWMQCFKKASGIPTLTHAEALDIALMFGWIDGQSKSFDENSWLQKYTPRRKKSIWSKINIENIARLTKLGKMKTSGLAEVEAAKADGRWAAAYDSPSNYIIPDDFLKELAKDKKAKAFFETLNKSNKYAIAWRLQTAKKPQTREKRMKQILDMLSKQEKFH